MLLSGLTPVFAGASALPAQKLRFSGTNVPDALNHGMPCVNIESPFSGKTPEERQENIDYARALMLDSLRKGEAPWVMHLMYPQVVNDDIPADRNLGITAGLAIGGRMDKSVVGIDRGISTGVAYGELAAWSRGKHVEARSLQGKPLPTEDELKIQVAQQFPKILAQPQYSTITPGILALAAAHPQPINLLA